ncbi:MAG: type VI secretion system tube protein Hcp, partial [bacterium]|nr:type VI secretion system tube protein Hcp [bacterium]
VMGQAEKTEKTKETTEATTPGSIEYFLNIPGAKGTASRPGFEGWVEALTFSYRNLELPPPRDLMNAPPPVLRAIKTAKEIGRPICSFSKLQNDADTVLEKALANKQEFPQWEVTLCTPQGKPFMNFLFKGVTISGLSKRGTKQYVTFRFERVVWNYNR